MIISFACADIEALFNDERVKRFVDIEKTARRKLEHIEYSETIAQLRSPPNNRLELLKGNLKGFYSIRINDQWRICFKFNNGQASEVAIVDYH